MRKGIGGATGVTWRQFKNPKPPWRQQIPSLDTACARGLPPKSPSATLQESLSAANPTPAPGSSASLPALAADQPVTARFQTVASFFASIPDPQQRFSHCVERARSRPLLPEALRTDNHRVDGCQVRIWVVPRFENGRCWFESDSDALTLKALSGLLCELFSGGTPEEILQAPTGFPDTWRLTLLLAENRRKTIERIAQQIHDFARVHVRFEPRT